MLTEPEQSIHKDSEDDNEKIRVENWGTLIKNQFMEF
jgi:hypothetical protein